MKKKLSAFIAALALMLGVGLVGTGPATAAPAPLGYSAVWSQWIDCAYGIGWTPFRMQITYATGSTAAVATSIQFGNGNSEHIEYVEYYNSYGAGQRVYDHTWPSGYGVTSFTSPFWANPYLPARADRHVGIFMQRQAQWGQSRDCSFNLYY